MFRILKMINFNLCTILSAVKFIDRISIDELTVMTKELLFLLTYFCIFIFNYTKCDIVLKRVHKCISYLDR